MNKHTLARHNIKLLFWANIFGTVSFLQPVLTLFYIERGLSETNILFVMIFWSAGVLLGEVPTGIFADKFGAKVSFITGATVKFFSISILLLAYEPWLFFLSSILLGLSASFFSGADEALIYESLKLSNEQNKMDKAMGKIQSATFITMTVAVIIGSYVAKDLKEDQFIFLILLGLAFQLVEIILLFFVKNPTKATDYKENPFVHVKDGIRAIKQEPQLLFMFLNLTIVFIPAAAVFEKFDQLYLSNAGLPVAYIGIAYAVSGIIGFIASISIGWLTGLFSRYWLFYGTGIFSALLLFVAAKVEDSLLIALVVFLFLRFIKAIRYPIYSQLSNDLIPSNVRATTISLLSIIDSCFDFLIFGTIASFAYLGVPTIYLACAIIALFGTIIPIKRIKRRSAI
ncbi:MFS transporter [Lottiidibacillus patelloidae]|uniref:MFS transporter n=1 Tax=Lottiidibacillus patelloidae TaxID=2670334 RepID=A0A263BRI3_9BACI|nr:MFS transporter [Lottiidibacillus patelloidae]OZM56304.1 MFS transporter [Lottiidibacillus patelloidae]